MSDDALSHSLTELSRLLLREETLESTLQRVAVLAAHLLPDADAASVTVADAGGHPRTASSTADLIAQLDAEQYRLNEGPCLAALRERALFQIDSMGEDSRWRRFADVALEAGIRSLLAVPHGGNGASFGAINFYSREPHVFTEVDRGLATLFATQASVAADNARMFADAQAQRDAMAQRLQEALRSRAMIDQAIGVVMEREHLSPEEAFTMLRNASQRVNVKVRDIAAEIVQSARRTELDL
ncbi:MAG TPA: GAF and ANTAR domain-containing protein [Actinomycetota bacterium]|nr:GAF and ANTAR domain-containing protein [Actinomycetota bacterium]